MQAARWARAHPECEFLGTDVSKATVAIARDLARKQGLTNVRFEVADLRNAGHNKRFDLVVCTGVVHHLADPKVGLRAVARALKPGGEALLMVYRRGLRVELASTRRKVLSATGEDASPSEKFDVAVQVLADRNDRLSTLLRRLAKVTPSLVADALINPIEHHYEAEDLCALTDGTGLEFDRWLHPDRWTSQATAELQLEFFARLHNDNPPITTQETP